MRVKAKPRRRTQLLGDVYRWRQRRGNRFVNAYRTNLYGRRFTRSLARDFRVRTLLARQRYRRRAGKRFRYGKRY